MDFTSLVGNDGVSDYSYDATSQLTDADHDFQTDEDYSFDENGNRTSTGYTTGDNNQLTSDGTFDYVYDDEGNRSTRTRISTDPADDYTTEYTWDHHNRLTKLVYKDKTGAITKEIDYRYDLFGRRIEKSIDADGAGAGAAVDTEYVYFGDHVALALDGNGDIINRYLHGPVVDQILADEQVTSTSSPGEVLWPLTDNLGSVRDIVDSDGNVDNHITYDSFGNITSETAASVDHIFGYTGRERDEESDLQFNRARYYDPAVGRWISEDPIGFAAGDTNLGRYVENAPTNFVDPSGLEVAVPTNHFNGLNPFRHYAPRAQSAADRFVGEIAASMIPGVGEAMDVHALATASTTWQWLIAAASLGASAVSFGTSPNFGFVGRAAGEIVDGGLDASRRISRAATEAANQSRRAATDVGQAASQGGRAPGVANGRQLEHRPQGSRVDDSPHPLPRDAEERIDLIGPDDPLPEGVTNRSRFQAGTDNITGRISVNRQLWESLNDAQRARIYWEEIYHQARVLRHWVWMRYVRQWGQILIPTLRFEEELRAAWAATNSFRRAFWYAWHYEGRFDVAGLVWKTGILAYPAGVVVAVGNLLESWLDDGGGGCK